MIISVNFKANVFIYESFSDDLMEREAIFFTNSCPSVCLKTPSVYQAKLRRMAIRLVNQDSKIVCKVPPVV